jgi:hypothetical protein
MTMNPIGYSPRQFASAVSISLSLLYKLWREERGPPFKMMGNRRIVPHDTGVAWLRKFNDAEDRTRERGVKQRRA